MILPIYIYNSEVLRAENHEIDFETINKEEFAQFLENMQQTMENADGVGLAAPQVGKNVRVLIVDGRQLTDTYPELKNFHRIMINPTILEQSEDTVTYGEGCLSIPDVHCDVVRPKSLTISYYDQNFELKTESLDGFGCRMVQHEMDHLEGVLFIDKVSPIRKKMIGSKLHNMSKGKFRTHYKTKQ